MVVRGAWTKEEVERLNSYLAMGLSVPEIASNLDRDPSSVHNKIYHTQMTPEKREVRRERHRAYRREHSIPMRNWMHENAMTVMSCRPAEELLAERDTRYTAPLRDLTAFLLGDPPIGYSALDKRTT